MSLVHVATMETATVQGYATEINTSSFATPLSDRVGTARDKIRL
jgi:hypothetical protein